MPVEGAETGTSSRSTSPATATRTRSCGPRRSWWRRDGPRRPLQDPRRRQEGVARTRSRRPTASSRASTTRTAIRATPPAEERFKEISAAYDVLGDPEKRKQYDRGGLVRHGRRRRGRPAGPPAASRRPTSARSGHPLQPVRRRRPAAAAAGARGARAGRARARPRPRGRGRRSPSIRRSRARRSRWPSPTTQPCPTCRGTGAKPGTRPKVCPRCQGRGIESQGQGLFSISQPCSRCDGARRGHRGPVPDLPGRRARRARSRATASTSPPASATARACGWPARARPGRNGGPPGDLYVITHVRASPVFKRKGDNLEVEVPLTIPEAIARRRGRGADAQRPQEAARPAGHQARHRPAPARRGPAEARRQGPRRHPLPLRHRRPGDAQRRAVRGGRQALARS